MQQCIMECTGHQRGVQSLQLLQVLMFFAILLTGATATAAMHRGMHWSSTWVAKLITKIALSHNCHWLFRTCTCLFSTMCRPQRRKRFHRESDIDPVLVEIVRPCRHSKIELCLVNGKFLPRRLPPEPHWEC